MREHRNHPRAPDAIQLVTALRGYARQWKLNEHRARAAQREPLRAKIAIRFVEHDLPSELKLRHRGRLGAKLVQDVEVQLVRRVGDARRVQMRREHDALHSIRGELLEHPHRRLERTRAVVHSRQEMRVQIDHRAALTSSAAMRRIASAPRATSSAGRSLAASNAYVTSASAASRSTADSRDVALSRSSAST